MAFQGAAVPQASYHIEVSSADGAAPQSEPPPAVSESGAGARSVVLVRAASDGTPAADEARSVKYVLTGLQAAHNGASIGITPVKSLAAGSGGEWLPVAGLR